MTDTTAAGRGLVPLEAVIAALPVAAVVLDGGGTVCLMNAAGERLLTRGAGELLGRPLTRALPDAGDLLGFLRAALHAGSAVSWEGRHPRTGARLSATAAPVGGFLLVTLDEAGAPPPDRPGGAAEAGDTERDRLAFLAQVTETMIGTLDTGESATRLAELAVSRLCDWAVVALTGEDGHPAEEGRAHRDPDRRADVDIYRDGRIPVVSPTTPMVVALRTGRPVQLTSLDEPAIAATLPTERVRAAWRRLGTTSATIVPLRAHGETFGALALMNTGRRPPHTPAEIATAVEVAERGALALDNARLYGRQLDVALTLQRSLLTPPPQTDPDRLQIAVRYRPASRHQAVGGDWYDSFAQPDGATVLVIGDVVGHNVDASAAMGQIRSMLRALALDQPGSPAHVLGRLDRVLAGLHVDRMATALLARVEQSAEQADRGLSTLRWSSAGHVPPLLLHSGGAVQVLATAPERLLGADWTGPRSDHEVLLRPGDTVLLVTDGLVEHGHCDLDQGMARLTAILGELTDLPVDQLCDQLLERVVTGHADDDIALLALRCQPQTGP